VKSNKKRCTQCDCVLKLRTQVRFCSNKCQQDSRYKSFIHTWKAGEYNNYSRNISKHIRRYLIERFGEKCSNCKWSKRHKITKRVPLEVDHIDGNSGNNFEDNLRLLCPNCHSLTVYFRNLNRGNGRIWRNK
jgi:HNH endonuclease